MTNQLRKKRLANQLTNQINRNIEAKLQNNLQNFFETLKQKVLVAFDEYYNETFLLQGHVDLILAPIHEAEQEYYELLLNANREMYNRGKQQGERLVSNAHRNSMKAKKKTVDFLHDKDKPLELFGTIQSSEEYLEQYTFTATEKTMSRVDGEINKILTDGYKEGWGVKDVRNRIMERYGQFSSWEANRIARTEMQTAHNMGVMQSFQELGVEYKEWRSAHDGRVRTSHIYMDGEIAPLDEPFSNGLMYPGDKSGRIEEWINCRCSMVPYLMPPGSVAPVGQGTFRASDLVSVSEPDYGRLLKEHTGGQLNWQQYKQVLHGKPVNVGVGATVQAINEPTEEQLKSNLTKEELEEVRWAKSVLSKDFHTVQMKERAKNTLTDLYGKALSKPTALKPKPVETPKPTVKEPVKPKTPAMSETNRINHMTSDELYESMTKADKKKYDKFKQRLENGRKYDYKPIIEKNLLEIRKLEQKQRDKLLKRTKPRQKPKPSPYERTLDKIHKDIDIPTEELIPELEKWIGKRCKNTAEFGYNFDVKTGKIIGGVKDGEIRGKKGHITMRDIGEGTGSIHSHPRNGMSAPSVEDLETFRCKQQDHHIMVSEHELWYVKATDRFGIGGMGQQLDLQKAHQECKERAYEKVAKEVKRGKIEATEEAIAKQLDKYTGDEILKTFNSPPWNETMTVKRYYL